MARIVNPTYHCFLDTFQFKLHSYIQLELKNKNKKTNMKKLIILFLLGVSLNISAQTTPFWTNTSYKGAFPVTDGTSATNWTSGWSNFDPENTNYPSTTSTLSSDITYDQTIGGNVFLQNKVYVKNGATLTILPGTIIRGDKATQATLIVTKGCKIIAEGTQNLPIVFTSNESVGNRTEGDWGGLVILGQATNNQPGGVANIEGIVPTANTQYGGSDDNDNSGKLKYVRIEFAGIALEPNKEINGITFGSVGRGTLVDYVQVSFSGDDSYEWFGGTVDCKHLIAYRGIDDDFDTDFGYRGRIQFGLIIRDNTMYDAAGDSNGLESDNDAAGSANTPQTAAIFSNLTIIGAKGNGSLSLPTGEKFEKAFRIRRNSSISVFNSLVVGWEKGLSIEGASCETNVTSGTLVFSNNVLTELPLGASYVTATPTFFTTVASVNDTTTSVSQINWINAFPALGTTPDCRLDSTSLVATGADFTNSKFVGGFVSVNEIAKTTNVSIYPNPATNNINITTDKLVQVTLIDGMGKVINTQVVSGTFSLDVSNLNNGIYFLQVDNTTKKIIVRK